MELVLAIITGSLFGMALYLAGASNPSKISAMLRLEYLNLMKIIVFAIGLASILLGASCILDIIQIGHIHIKEMNLGVIIGGLIFGLGFGTAGTCPGTCVAAAGTKGIRKAMAAILGGLLGAWCFAITYGLWKQTGIFNLLNLGKMSLFKVSDQYGYLLPGSYYGLMGVGALFLLLACLLPRDR